MKTNIDGVIVVEGKSDVGYLTSFINSLFFITNGLDVSKEKLDFLKRVSEKRKLIILTDNDEAGERIRNLIKQEISAVFVGKTSKNSRKNYKKHGVAEANKEEVLEILSPFVTEKPISYENYDLVSLVSLSQEPSKKRSGIIKKYRLINGNNKFIENQLRMLCVSKEELWK